MNQCATNLYDKWAKSWVTPMECWCLILRPFQNRGDSRLAWRGNGPAVWANSTTVVDHRRLQALRHTTLHRHNHVGPLSDSPRYAQADSEAVS